MTALAVNSHRHDEQGMTTAEYAVGTVAAVTGVGALVGLCSSDWFSDILRSIIEAILKLILSAFGL